MAPSSFKFWRMVPFALLLRSYAVCSRWHKRTGVFERRNGADVLIGWRCTRCGMEIDLKGGFVRWTR